MIDGIKTQASRLCVKAPWHTYMIDGIKTQASRFVEVLVLALALLHVSCGPLRSTAYMRDQNSRPAHEQHRAQAAPNQHSSDEATQRPGAQSAQRCVSAQAATSTQAAPRQQYPGEGGLTHERMTSSKPSHSRAHDFWPDFILILCPTARARDFNQALALDICVTSPRLMRPASS